MSQYSATITVMMEAVRAAVRSLTRDFGEVEHLQVSKKGPGDFVTTADLKAEKILYEALHKARPDYGFLMEERGEIKGKDERYRWIVDPLDGTLNFMHGMPYFSVTVALEERRGDRSEIIACVTDAPILKELFWAERGCGAWLERFDGRRAQRLRVAERHLAKDAVLALPSMKRHYHLCPGLIDHVATIRSIGSTALSMAYIAMGRLDAFVVQKPNLWDVAAGVLFVKEAGGVVINFKGKSYIPGEESLIASNDTIAPQIRTLL